MTEPPSSERSLRVSLLGVEAAFHPQLGDLATDTARNACVGVVVAVPGEDTASYHLRPPGGGRQWSASGDGTTLRPVRPTVSHATFPPQQELVYDHRSAQGALPLRVHFTDGGACEAIVILTLADVEVVHVQSGRILDECRRRLGETP
ncbi:hypothetical protein [Streptomyces sp. NPDC020965]|uniref:hypothetical protein n=1 Tax=Streptomyces sp. NPDC020965 TaxID=3365105 RepID=UPI0037B18F78